MIFINQKRIKSTFEVLALLGDTIYISIVRYGLEHIIDSSVGDPNVLCY